MKQKEYLEELRSKHMGKGAVVGRIQNLQFDLERLEEKIRRHEALFLDARQIAERMKARLLERSIDVKRYEKLKDIEYEQFLKKLKAEEMSRMDEISTTRYAHR
jgi:flagellar FliJ protein